MDIGLAFSYPFQDEEWITKLLLVGVILLVPVLGLIVVLERGDHTQCDQG